MKIQKLDHVGIGVWDIQKAMEFFEGLFETKFGPLIDVESPRIRLWERMGPMGIDLAEPKDLDTDAAKVLRRRGQGLNFLSFKVEDIDEAIAEMKSRGIREIWRADAIVDGQTVKAVGFHPQDSYGVMIELTEYTGDLHPLAKGDREGTVRLNYQDTV